MRRSVATPRTYIPVWVKITVGIALGAGGVVAATYNKFETIDAHAHDVGRIEQLLIEKDRLDQQRYESILQYLLGRPDAHFKQPPDGEFPPKPEAGPDA
jgi:hypothetical protein